MCIDIHNKTHSSNRYIHVVHHNSSCNYIVHVPVHVVLAAWRDNRNIGEKEVCHSVLREGRFDAEQLLQEASQDRVKTILSVNTAR